MGVVPIAGELAQQFADEWRGFVVEGDTAQVDVVVGFFSGAQGHSSVNNGELFHQFSEAFEGKLVDFSHWFLSLLLLSQPFQLRLQR